LGCRALGFTCPSVVRPQLFSRIRLLLEAAKSCCRAPSSDDMEMWWLASSVKLLLQEVMVPVRVLLSLPVPFMNTSDHSAGESWAAVQGARQSFGSPIATQLLSFLWPFHRGPSCRAVRGAAFWKSRALSCLLPSSVQTVSGTRGLGMACISPTPSPRDPAPRDRTNLQGLRPCTTLQTWAQLHNRPFWPCSAILQHEADVLRCYERTLLWAVVSGYHVASRTGLLGLDNSAGIGGTGPLGATATHLPATAGLSFAALRSRLLLGVT